MLSSIVIIGYAGWITYVVLLLLNDELRNNSDTATPIVWRPVASVQAVLSTLLVLERHALLYHLYCVFAVFFWAEIWRRRRTLQRLYASVSGHEQMRRRLVDVGFAMAVLHLLVLTFYVRAMLSLACLLIALWTLRGEGAAERKRGREHILLVLCCVTLAVFPLLPPDAGEQLSVVLLASLLSAAFVVYQLHSLQCAAPSVVWVLGALPLLAGALVAYTSWSLSSGAGLPLCNQVLSWLLLVGSLGALPLASQWLYVRKVDARNGPILLCAVFALTVTAYLLLSVAYESVFLVVLVITLRVWLLCGSAPSAETGDYHPRSVLRADRSRFSMENIRITLAYVRV
jgi:Phosphatidylinositolglycan class N (PIG-N)